MSIVEQLGIRILFLCSYVRYRWVEVQGVKMIVFFINRSFKSGQHGRVDGLAPLSARL